MFEDEFIDNLPNDPYEAARSMVDMFLFKDMGIPLPEKMRNYDAYVEGFAAFEAFIQAFGLPFSPPELITGKEPNLGIILAFFQQPIKSLRS